MILLANKGLVLSYRGNQINTLLVLRKYSTVTNPSTESLTVSPISRSSRGIGQATFLPVLGDARVKQLQTFAAHLRPKLRHNLVIHEQGEDGSLHEGREEGLAVGRLVREIRSLVKVLELLSVVLPLLELLLWVNHKLVVGQKIFYKKLDKRFSNGRGEVDV